MNERDTQDVERNYSDQAREHPAMTEVVVEGRHVWVERDAAGHIVAVSESRQVLEDTDDDYAVIVRHRQPDKK